ncbi:MAG: ABC transporter ATP-binding protein [Acidobacteriota bacterium]
MNAPAVELVAVNFAYANGPRILHDVTLSIGSGLSLLVGPNGCGKSTLARVVAGVERPQSGSIKIFGIDAWRDEAAARRELVYVPDPPDITPYANIGDVVMLAARLRGHDHALAQQALARAGLQSLAGRSARELSLGQKRRALLAAAWTHSAPRLLILDEPLEAMDRNMRDIIESWIGRAVGRQAAVLVVTHDLEPFLAQAQTLITVANGRVAATALPDQLEHKRALVDVAARGGG